MQSFSTYVKTNAGSFFGTPVIMVDFQTLNCRYSFGIWPMWPKFCVTLVTGCDLRS